MEYNGGYLDDEELSHLNQEQGNGIDAPQYEQQPPQDAVPTHRPVVDEEELLAAQAAADAAVAQQQQQGQPGGVFANVGQGLVGKNRDMMMQYWQETINSIEHDEHDFKNHQLPLARIKKVMKTDEDVRMISAEAPILFAKGCDVFITELTMRAWIHAEENKRRTLQKSDIAAALTKLDMFDFLIDVVPREEEKPKKTFPPQSRTGSYVNSPNAHLIHQLPMHAQQLRGSSLPNQSLPGSIQGPSVPGSSQVPGAGQKQPGHLVDRVTQNAQGEGSLPEGIKEEEQLELKKEEKKDGYTFETYSGYAGNY